ncbi:MAG TPA: sigma 54-interacting transcriptional regulator [Candidatus Krumholzibacteria bacterium]|nr:sigma 54-interacting transcriptional regulator [Candidatus Krumholzibacteria bacterium]
MCAARNKKPSPDPLEQLGRRRPPAEAAAPVAGSDPASPGTRHPFEDLLDVAVSLTSTLNLTDILNNIVDGIIRVTGCERGFLMLRGADGSLAAFTGRYRDHREWDEGMARAISRTIVQRVQESREPFVSSDLGQMDDLKGTESIQTHRIQAAVCLPLLYKDALTGVIYADSTFMIPRSLDSDRAVLLAFSAQAALAIENARRHGDLRDRRDRLEQQNLALRRQLTQEFAMNGMVSRNKTMLEVFALVEKFAPSDMSVLIQGESGTGKEVLAQALHEKSRRADKPFLAVNCAGMPDGLVSGILFGHRRGAFTGADTDRPGIFELVDGGTLFLDEIGDMPLETQPKLLRVLEKREVSRLGEEGVVRRVDFRIIAATNVDLFRAVGERKFREDLFYRLATVRFDLPPLRDRREDIIPLAEYFLKTAAEKMKIPTPELSRDARSLLMSKPWPGNVRELKNATEVGIAFRDERHVIHADGIDHYFKNHQPGPAPSGRGGGTLKEQAEQFEARVIRDTLAASGNNVSRAAAVLGISRQQLHTKIRRYGIDTHSE